MMLPAFAALLLLPSAARSQQITEAQRAHLSALGEALGQCHREGAVRYARTQLAVGQVVARVLADCSSREVPMRVALTRHMGRRNTERMLAGERPHWREAIQAIVVRERARG
jgi:hypothetical protein